MIIRKKYQQSKNDKNWYKKEIEKKRYEFLVENFSDVFDWIKNEIDNNWNLYGMGQLDLFLIGTLEFLLIEIPLIVSVVFKNKILYYTCDFHGRVAYFKSGQFYYRRDL